MKSKLYTNQPLPSSILHNSADVRAQYTRMAARKAFASLGQNLKPLYRQLRARMAWNKPAPIGH